MSALLPIPVPVNLEGLAKLIETVANGTGVLYEPRRIREKAKAERDAAIIKAEGDLEIQEIQRRFDQRTKARELRRQKNIDSIMAKAVNALPSTVNREPVDEDWISQFFNCCEDVGNEDMQVIWARLLAGEVAHPGTFSPRTLALVKVLRPKDAGLFRLFCDYLWNTQDEGLIHICTDSTDEYLESKGLSFDQMLHLHNLGLINAEPLLVYAFKKETSTISYFGQSYTLVSSAFQHSTPLCIRPPTSIGNELAPLCETKPDEGYRKLIFDRLAQVGGLMLLPSSET